MTNTPCWCGVRDEAGWLPARSRLGLAFGQPPGVARPGLRLGCGGVRFWWRRVGGGAGPGEVGGVLVVPGAGLPGDLDVSLMLGAQAGDEGVVGFGVAGLGACRGL